MSQRSQKQPQSEDSRAAAADDLIRYILFRSADNPIFTRTEVQKKVLPGRCEAFDDILNRAKSTLKNVYGYNLMKCETERGGTKSFIVTNILPSMQRPIQEEENLDNVLLVLVLSHLFMAGGSANETSLQDFLDKLGVDIETKSHETFGSVKTLLHKFVKNQYLVVETDNKTFVRTYKWGMRAEKQIPKKALLEFVCQIYGNKKPENWKKQFEDAEQQELAHAEGTSQEE